jgi:hypothetical protein
LNGRMKTRQQASSSGGCGHRCNQTRVRGSQIIDTGGCAPMAYVSGVALQYGFIVGYPEHMPGSTHFCNSAISRREGAYG